MWLLNEMKKQSLYDFHEKLGEWDWLKKHTYDTPFTYNSVFKIFVLASNQS